MYYLCVHVLHDYNLWTVYSPVGLATDGNVLLSGVAAKFFSSTLYQMSIFKSLEIGFCDPRQFG